MTREGGGGKKSGHFADVICTCPLTDLRVSMACVCERSVCKVKERRRREHCRLPPFASSQWDKMSFNSATICLQGPSRGAADFENESPATSLRYHCPLLTLSIDVDSQELRARAGPGVRAPSGQSHPGLSFPFRSEEEEEDNSKCVSLSISSVHKAGPALHFWQG